MNEQQKLQQSFQNKMNNAQGHYFEQFILGGCSFYMEKGIAAVTKMPEPFRVLKKDSRTGIATVRFTKKAQPDFIGTLKGGRTIVFEAKRTSTDRINDTVLTETQRNSLEKHFLAGAYAGVCAGLGDINYFIPWEVWRDMKNLFGHKYMTASEAEPYRVKFNGVILFLDFVHKDMQIKYGPADMKGC